MSNEGSSTKLVLPINPGNSTSTTPTSSSPPPLSLNGEQQQQAINLNGDGKLTSNGVLSDLQSTFQGSSWSNVIDVSGDHSFDIPNGNRMFETQPTPLMTMQQQMSYQQAIQRRPITAAHNFPTQNIRPGNGLPMNGRWTNEQSSTIGPPPHLQQAPQSPTWNQGFSATSARRPVLPNVPMSQSAKKGQNNNFFPFLPQQTTTTNQNPSSIRPATSVFGTNFPSTQNGADLGQNFPSGDAYDMNSFHQIMDIMRNDNVKRVYNDDNGMSSLLDNDNLISNGNPTGMGNMSTGLFNTSPRGMTLDMNKEERFSRKVFVGGLPPDIDEEEIIAHFQRFGPLIVDWPHKQESKSYFPPKGYAFLIFTYERSVQELIDECVIDDSKLYMCVSSPSMKDKAVQIRPWLLADSDFVMDGTQPLDPRKTIFVGGVPRPLCAVELAMIMDRLYRGVCYAGIDTDPELKYPKGAGRVAFSNQQSYIAAISARFVQLQHGEIDKRVEVKPYVLDDQLCDECAGARCGGKFAPFFCANVTCLQYYCEACWASIHARAGREYHKPLVKEGADRPRSLPFRW